MTRPTARSRRPQSAGRNPQHVQQTRTYITRIITLSRVERTTDLNGSAAMQAIGGGSRIIPIYQTTVRSQTASS